MTSTETLGHQQLFVAGEWRDGGAGTFADLNPATEEKLADVAAASAEDVDAAVAAARAQLSGEWAALPGSQRGQILNRVAELIERDGKLLARLEALDVGKPVMQPTLLDIPKVAMVVSAPSASHDHVRTEPVPQRVNRGPRRRCCPPPAPSSSHAQLPSPGTTRVSRGLLVGSSALYSDVASAITVCTRSARRTSAADGAEDAADRVVPAAARAVDLAPFTTPTDLIDRTYAATTGSGSRRRTDLPPLRRLGRQNHRPGYSH